MAILHLDTLYARTAQKKHEYCGTVAANNITYGRCIFVSPDLSSSHRMYGDMMAMPKLAARIRRFSFNRTKTQVCTGRNEGHRH